MKSADRFVENLGAKGVKYNKIIHIPNWVDTNFVCPLPKKDNYFRQNYNLQNKFVVLYSGNIALTQGLERVVKSATQLRNFIYIIFVILDTGCVFLRAVSVQLLHDIVLIYMFLIPLRRGIRLSAGHTHTQYCE